MEALRAEFPGTFAALARLGRIAIPRATVLEAFVMGIGAAFIVRAVAQVAVALLFPILFPSTAPHPSWVTPSVFSDGAGEVAAGLVLVRAGGARPLALYVALELLVLVSALPSRLLFCSRAPGFVQVPCDLPGLVAARWPLWLALALGAALARAVTAGREGESPLLRAAGAFSLVITVIGNLTAGAYGLAGSTPSSLAVDGIFAVAWIVAGLAAGVLLWHPGLARPVLFALCLVGPPFTLALPTLVTSLRGPVPANMQPAEYQLAILATVLLPAAGVVALFAGRAFRREWGTFF